MREHISILPDKERVEEMEAHIKKSLSHFRGDNVVVREKVDTFTKMIYRFD